MDGALGDALAVLMGELLDELIVLQQDGPAGAGGGRILVVTDAIARGRGQGWAFCHG
jgi:hypothetical protein